MDLKTFFGFQVKKTAKLWIAGRVILGFQKFCKTTRFNHVVITMDEIKKLGHDLERGGDIGTTGMKNTW